MASQDKASAVRTKTATTRKTCDDAMLSRSLSATTLQSTEGHTPRIKAKKPSRTNTSQDKPRRKATRTPSKDHSDSQACASIRSGSKAASVRRNSVKAKRSKRAGSKQTNRASTQTKLTAESPTTSSPQTTSPSATESLVNISKETPSTDDVQTSVPGRAPGVKHKWAMTKAPDVAKPAINVVTTPNGSLAEKPEPSPHAENVGGKSSGVAVASDVQQPSATKPPPKFQSDSVGFDLFARGLTDESTQMKEEQEHSGKDVGSVAPLMSLVTQMTEIVADFSSVSGSPAMLTDGTGPIGELPFSSASYTSPTPSPAVSPSLSCAPRLQTAEKRPMTTGPGRRGLGCPVFTAVVVTTSVFFVLLLYVLKEIRPHRSTCTTNCSLNASYIPGP